MPTDDYPKHQEETFPVKIYYDNDCGFCSKGVSILQKTLAIPKQFIIPAQMNETVYNLMQKENSWVVVKKEHCYYKARALAQVLLCRKWTSLFGCVLLLPGFIQLADWFYGHIARHRHGICTFQ